MSGFLRLIYLSKATRPLSQDAMRSLLDTCETNNAVCGLTGVLCAGRGYFLQTLEGMEDMVIDVYARILKDPRHQDCNLLDIGITDMPIFTDWKMGFVDGDKLPPQFFNDMLLLRTTHNRREQTAHLLQNFLTRLRQD